MVFSISVVIAGFMGYIGSNKEQIDYLKATIDKNQAITDTLTKSQQNDLHTLEGKMEQQRETIEQLSLQITKLTTIIDERIPAKRQ